MASVMFTDCSSMSSTLLHVNGRRGAILFRHCVGQLRLRSTASARGCSISISIRCSSSPSSATSVDGKAVAKTIRDEITIDVSRMKESIGVVPGLAVILVLDERYHTHKNGKPNTKHSSMPL
ncbi:hypothetical protein F2Q70_00000043 [Brassica cretica]|uniref:Uncharacterized protein n=1 Tax=Brassica cretica TaxID=69181 RepID=A0A8S9J0W2_BRACR|nr:hypothetical protein F2Q70_00000043 [Brassica cretica]